MITMRLDTSSDAIRLVVNSIYTLLTTDDRVEKESVRVRLYRIGAFSLDVDVFAYVLTRQWHEFLETQAQLLHGIMEILRQSGVSFAFPSQTMYLASDSDSGAQIVVRAPISASETDERAPQENPESKSPRPAALGRAV